MYSVLHTENVAKGHKLSVSKMYGGAEVYSHNLLTSKSRRSKSSPSGAKARPLPPPLPLDEAWILYMTYFSKPVDRGLNI